MQNVCKYNEWMKNSEKYDEVQTYLKQNHDLFTWRADENILDAGCGPGVVTAHILLPWLPDDFRCVLGVDVSANMIQHALEQYESDKLTYATVDIESNLTHLLKDEKWANGFDKVFSFFVLHWLQDLRLGMKNMHHIMNLGAQALIVFPIDRAFQKTYNKVGTNNIWKKYTQDVKRKIPSFPQGPDPRKEFEEMLSSVGFKVIKCETWVEENTFSSINTFKSLIESLNQDMDCIPSELKDAYLDDCVEEMTRMGVLGQTTDKVIRKQSMILAVIVKM